MSLSHAQTTRLTPPYRIRSRMLAGSLTIACAVAAAAISVGVRVAAHAAAASQASATSAASPAPYVPRQIVVSYKSRISSAGVLGSIRKATGLKLTRSGVQAGAPNAVVALLPKDSSMTVPEAAERIADVPGVSYAVPNYIAHAAGGWIPDDPGKTNLPGGWQQLQWNFGASSGIDAPDAWANLRTAGRPGAKGVVIAVVDTGVAFTNWGKFTRSPDLASTTFASPCDLVSGKYKNGKCTDPNALDREGHGTFVASALAEATNNGTGLTGLAYGATIIPIRVLDSSGNGTATAIADGIRYAVAKGARVINLSMEFSLTVTSRQIPEILSAIEAAHRQGDVVVAAAGNDYAARIAYPARAGDVISVGATTKDRCVATYSDNGSDLDIVAPGGGADSGSAPGNCHPSRSLPDVYQMTFDDPEKPTSFSLPGGWYGTSMAAPDVSAAAAMVIASGVLGPNPSPDAILHQLEQTATPLGGNVPNEYYGYGLLNLAAATTKKPSPPVTTTPTTPTVTTGPPLVGTGTTTTPAPTKTTPATQTPTATVP